MEISIGRALGAALGALARQSWLASLGMAVGMARGLVALPATAFVAAVTVLALSRSAGPLPLPGGTTEAWGGWLLALATSARFRGIAVGLWLSGLLLWAALWATWVAGALPVVAAELAGERTEGRFSGGVAYRSGRVLVAAALALALDLLAQAVLLATGVGVLRLAGPARASSAPLPVALVAAAAGASAVALAAVLVTLGETTIGRTALSGERPAVALRRSVAAIVRRPGAFLVTSATVVLALLLGVASAQGAMSLLVGALRVSRPAQLVAPEILLAALVALVVAFAELWRLSALGALALSTYPGGGRRSSLRSESLGMRPPSQ